MTERATLIDGKAFAAGLVDRVKAAAARLRQTHGVQPGLAVVIVGEDPASQVYVRSKGERTVEAGMYSETHRLPEATGQAGLLALIDRLNADPKIHGVLVQLPLPKHINADAVLGAIDPDKDVDGFHVVPFALAMAASTSFSTSAYARQIAESFHRIGCNF